MGTYTKIAITKRSIPPSKYDELVKFLEEEMMHEGEGINKDGYFLSFSARKFGRNRHEQKTKLAGKLNEIFEETKRKHWGEKEPQVFKAWESSNKFSEWDYEKEVKE